MILVDTSAWVEFQRATGSPVDVALTEAITNDELLATTGIVVLELLAGGRDEQHAHALRRLLDRCDFLEVDEPSDYETAAALYRACRRAGRTVRRLPDCLIAAIAIRTGARVLCRDADFAAIAGVSRLELVAPA